MDDTSTSTSESAARPAAPLDGLIIVATPLDSAVQAGTVAVSMLEEAGLGRWTITWSHNELVPGSFALVDQTGADIGRLEPADDVARAAPPKIVRWCAELLATIGDRDASARRLSEALEHAKTEAGTDELTHLPNRRSWREALHREFARATRHGLSLAVVIVDVDGLKEVNDEFGHLAGDILLRLTAGALRSAVRVEDVVARLGGDEFGVLNVHHSGEAPINLVGRIEEALAAANVPASIGGAVHETGEPIEATVRRADAAMYEAKARRRAS